LVNQFRRETQTVQERAEALMTLSSEQGFPQWLPYGMILRGWVLTTYGEGAEGIAQLRQGLVAHLDTRTGLHRPYFLSLLAEAHGKVGKPEEGLTVIDEALAIVNNTEERNWEAELHRLKGELLLMQQGQKVSEAEECFQQVFKIVRRQQTKSFELRAAMSLSRLWQVQGKRDEARQMLAEIYEWFTEGFDTADLQEAKALLEELA
jgi:predicted ATPase